MMAELTPGPSQSQLDHIPLPDFPPVISQETLPTAKTDDNTNSVDVKNKNYEDEELGHVNACGSQCAVIAENAHEAQTRSPRRIVLNRTRNNLGRIGNRRFEFQRKYPITRFSRKWKRQEVQGLCCLTIEVMCLVSLAVLSLQGMGYFGNLGDDGHVPHSFSWKLLREFYTYEEISPVIKDCMYFVDEAALKQIRRDRAMRSRYYKSLDEDELDYAMIDSFHGFQDRERETIEFQPRPSHETFTGNNQIFNAKQCDYRKTGKSIEWLVKILSANFIAVLNTITSALFFCSLSVRRRKGLQVILLIPSFICLFMSVFQQIPTTFHYNSAHMQLRDEMRLAMSQSNLPNSITPVMEETQVHMECCGAENPMTWEPVRGFNETGFPASCCNTTAFDCDGKSSVLKDQIWSEGCYQKQYDRVRSFEKWSLLILGFKIIAEIGIFCALSDLTRYDYPPPEAIENSRCEYREYLIKCKGIATIRGVTKDGRIVVMLDVLLTWRLFPSRTDMANGLLLVLKNDLNQIRGSVEIIKRTNLSTFLNEHIQVDLTRKNRGIFVFTLF